MSKNDMNQRRYRLFVSLSVGSQSEVFGFILRLLPNFSVAEDILQETMLTAWEKFSDFEEGTNFAAWVKQIARYKVMGLFHKEKNNAMVRFSDEVLERLAAQPPVSASERVYLEALHACIDKLKGRSREIVRLRYAKNLKIKAIAANLGTTGNALSKHISRVHHSLKKCIEQTLRAWDMTDG